MQRITAQCFAEAIGKAFENIPTGIVDRVRGVDFLTGVSPRFAGLHNCEKTHDGRLFSTQAHCVFPSSQTGLAPNDRRITIVLPVPKIPRIIVHELGHALDAALNFEHEAMPVTDYAKVNRFEAFAEAFTAWRYYDYAELNLGTMSEIDLRTEALFEALS